MYQSSFMSQIVDLIYGKVTIFIFDFVTVQTGSNLSTSFLGGGLARVGHGMGAKWVTSEKIRVTERGAR